MQDSRLVQLAEADRRKDAFLAMLGHELRNPLAPIMSSLKLMRLQGELPEQIMRCRETIAGQVSLMTGLVDDLLDVSRITRGKIELKMEHITLDHIVEHAVETVRPLIDERSHALNMNLPADSVAFHREPARLAQALAHLLHNAAKDTDPGGCISLSAHEQSDKLTLAVTDNRIVLGDRARPCRAGKNIRSLRPGDKLPWKGRRIPIVDDNVDAADSLGEFLKVSGYTIHLAHDGLTAIGEAIRLRPNVVILDIAMPTLNGHEAVQRLRKDAKLASTLLLAVTGYAQARDRISVLEAGFDHHLAKPLDISKLEALLNASQCRGYRTEQKR